MAPLPLDHMEDNSELQRDFGRLEQAVKDLTREVRESNALHGKAVEGFDDRLTAIEAWKMYVVAFGAGMAGTLATLGGIIWRLLPLLK